jgi:hypothetical protein
MIEGIGGAIEAIVRLILAILVLVHEPFQVHLLRMIKEME